MMHSQKLNCKSQIKKVPTVHRIWVNYSICTAFSFSRFDHILKAYKFELAEALKEWPKIKRLVRRKYGHLFKYQHSVWTKFLSTQKDQYPHCSMVIEIMLATMCSSSAVERGFSAVRRQLRDQRVLMKHKLLDESLRIKINMPMLRELLQNCDSLVVAKAVEIYHKKKKWRWKVKEPAAKKRRTEDEPVHTPKQTQEPNDSGDSSNSDTDKEYDDEDSDSVSYSHSSSDEEEVTSENHPDSSDENVD